MPVRFPTDSVTIARAKTDADLARSIVFDYDSEHESKLEEWCGEMLPLLLENFNSLVSALAHSTSKVRIAALLITRDQWPRLEELVLQCFRLAFEDPDESVRGVALFVLDRFGDWIDDPTGMLFDILWHDVGLEELTLVKPKPHQPAAYRVLLSERKMLEDLVGKQLLYDMLHSRKVSEKCLEDADEAVCNVALQMMDTEWQPTLHAATVAEKRMKDGDPRIRRIALSIVSNYYAIHNRGDTRIRSVLAKTVGDENEDLENRFCAYQKLCELCRMPVERWPIMHWFPEEFEPNRNVDWVFVNAQLSADQDT